MPPHKVPHFECRNTFAEGEMQGGVEPPHSEKLPRPRQNPTTASGPPRPEASGWTCWNSSAADTTGWCRSALFGVRRLDASFLSSQEIAFAIRCPISREQGPPVWGEIYVWALKNEKRRQAAALQKERSYTSR